MSSLDNKNYAFNEMMTHVPLCTHKEPQNILIVGNCDEDFKSEVKKHKVTATYIQAQELAAKNEKEFDVIIITQNGIVDNLSIANIDRILKDDGLISFSSKAYSKDDTQLKTDLRVAGEKFWISMPYKFGHSTAILASKKYHPTADIILQVSDLLDDLNYYNSEIQLASFVFPASIHRDLTGIAKR